MKAVSLLCGAALGLGLAVGQAGAASRPLEIKDVSGRTVRLPESPRRIVCLAPGALRLICLLGAADRVVGVEAIEQRAPWTRPYRLAHPEFVKLPVIGPGGVGAIDNIPPLEPILAVRPEAVFITWLNPAKADRMQRRLGAPVITLSYGPFASFDETLFRSLRIAGRALDKARRAEEVVAFIKRAREDLARRAAAAQEASRLKVYIGGVGFRGSRGIEGSNPDYLPFQWLGLQSVLDPDSARDRRFLDKEALLLRQPDVIFLDAGGLELIREDYKANPAFYRSLRAFHEGRVYVLHPYNWYVTNISAALADAYAIGKLLFPDRFADVDIRRRADRIYTFLLGKPVYAEMEKRYGPLGARFSP